MLRITQQVNFQSIKTSARLENFIPIKSSHCVMNEKHFTQHATAKVVG